MRTKGYTLIILILLAVLAAFSSCKTPQEKLAVLLKKNPELIKRDTVYKIITIPGKKADIKDTINLDTAKINKTLDSLKGKLTPETITVIKEVIRVVLKDAPFKPQEKDFNINGIKGKITVDKNGYLDIKIESTPYDTAVSTVINDVNPGNGIPPEKKSWFDEVKSLFWLIILFVVVTGVILWLLIKKE